MLKKRINWKLFVSLLLVFVVVTVVFLRLHKWQRNRMAVEARRIGNEAYQLGHWQKAAVNLGKYITFVPTDIETLLKYADAQLNRRPLKPAYIKQALNAYRTVLRLDNTHLPACRRLIDLYLQMELPSEAELIAREYLKNTQTPEIRTILARALTDQRKFKQANAELIAVIETHPEHIFAYEMLAQLSTQRPEVFSVPAEHWLNEAVKANPDSASAFITRAAHHLKNKQQAQALADLEQAERGDLSEPKVRLRLATEFINAGLLDKAREHLAAVRADSPTQPQLWRTSAVLAVKANAKSEMLDVATKGLAALATKQWDFMPVAIELFIRADALDTAVDYIDKLRQIDIAPEKAAFFEGLVAMHKDQGYKAIKCFQHAVRLGDKAVHTRINIANMFARLGDEQSALRELKDLVLEQPDCFEAHLALANTLYQVRKLDEAVKNYKQAMYLRPDSVDAALDYIRARMELLSMKRLEAHKPSTQYARRNTHACPEPSRRDAIQITDWPAWQSLEKRLNKLETITAGAHEVKLLQCKYAINVGHFSNARQLLADLKDKYPHHLPVDMTEVELLLAQAEFDRALSKLHDLVDIFPQSVLVVRHLADLLFGLGRHTDCETVLADAMQRFENPAVKREFGLALTTVYDRSGQPEKSQRLLAKLAEQMPNDIPIKRRLLTRKSVICNPALAQKLTDRIKNIEGEHGWQWRYEQAKVWFSQDTFSRHRPRIISFLKEILREFPSDQTSRLLLAATYEKACDFRLAVATYKEALNLDRRNLAIVAPTVSAMYKVAQYDQADEIIAQAEWENPTAPELLKLKLKSCFRQGRLNQADEIIRQLLATDPNSQSLRLSLGLVRLQQGNLDEAADLLNKLAAEEPNAFPVLVANIDLNILQDNGPKAIEYCDKLVELFDNTSAVLVRAKTYAKLGRIDKAMADFEQATTIEPLNPRAWLEKSHFYGSLDDLERSILSMQKALSLNPLDNQIKRNAVVLFLESADKDIVRQGRELLEKLLALNPKDTEMLLLKARLLLMENTAASIDEAINILRTITENNPQNAEAWELWATFLLNTARTAKAIDVVLTGLSHLPDNKSLLLIKAQIEAARSTTLAIPTLKSLLDSNPNDVDVAVLLADSLLSVGRNDEALSLLADKLNCYDGSDAALLKICRAVAMYKSGNKSAAREQSCRILEKLINEEPDCIDAMLVLGAVSTEMDRPEKSAVLYRKVLELEPDNTVAINNLAWIMCEEKNEYKQALELARQGLEKDPNYADLIDTRGVIYHRLDRFDDAIRDFTTCLKLCPTRTPASVKCYFHLGRTLAAVGRKESALDNLKHALDVSREITGLSPKESAEAKRLFEQLSANRNYEHTGN